jgi:peptidoglycan/LPS O-acetylase OafA/YrhL
MSKRIDDIEILRGFAVLFVVLHHALGNLFTWTTPGLARVAVYFSGGFGVDLFFAISGFVIARELVPRLQASTGPDMAVVLFNQSGVFGGFRTNLESTVAGVLQVANLRFAETFGRSEYGASFVYWTLSLEEQFYLILPLLVLVSRRFLPYVLIALVVFQLLSTRTLMTVVFRTDAIALGVLLAIWSQHSTYTTVRPVFLSRTWWAGTLAMLALCFCMGVVGSEVLHVVSYKFSLYAVLSVLLVWMASYNMDLFIPAGPLKRLLLWVGTRSYAIYLIHIPAFYLARELWFRLRPGVTPGDELFFPLLFTASALLILLSELNYRLIEAPFRLRGSRIAKRFLAAEPERTALNEPVIQPIKG